MGLWMVKPIFAISWRISGLTPRPEHRLRFLFAFLCLRLWYVSRRLPSTSSGLYETTKEIERVSGMQYAFSQTRGGICRYMIFVLVLKTIILLPYPVFQFIWIFVDIVPELAKLCIMLSFIILECFSNAAIFVRRPLSAQRKHRCISIGNNEATGSLGHDSALSV